ncbi:MAG: DUF4139 domain-containing protein [Polyangia bacterium]
MTVHARGAVVRRLVLVPAGRELPHGDVDLVIDDVTPLCEPGSLRAATSGGGRQVLQVHSCLVVPSTQATPGPSAARVQTLQQQLMRLQAEVERLQQRRQRIAKLFPDPALRTTSLVERVGERISDALATSRLLLDVQQQLDERQRELEQQLLDVQREKAAAELQASQASQAPGGPRAVTGQARRRVTVRVTGSGPVSELLVTYVVMAARYWPLYTLRVTDGGRRATWLIEANVAQLSGEDWSNVRLSLSSADLVYDARLPELPSLRLGRAQAGPRRGYRPPPDGLERMFAGYDQAFAAVPQSTLPPPPLGGLPPPPLGEEDSEKLELPHEGSTSASLDDEPTMAAMAERLLEEEADARRPPLAKKRAKPAPEPAREMMKEMARSTGAPPGAPPAFAVTAPIPLPQQSQRGLRVPANSPLPPELQALGRGRALGGVSGSFGGAAEDRDEGYGYGGGGRGGSAPEPEPPEPAELEPSDAWLDFDQLTLVGVEDPQRRGRLSRRSDGVGQRDRIRAVAQLEELAPSGLRDPRESRGRFDHRFDAEGLVGVPSDGQLHRVSLLAAEAATTQRLCAVPRERPEVYREAELHNPCDAPLLAGPVDVYVEGSLLTTTAIEHIDRGGTLRVGMGVEDRVRIARNPRTEEESAGLLGGSTVITQHISIELASALGQPITVEVLERVPVSEDKALAVEVLSVTPPASGYSQAERGAPIRGGMQWRLPVPAGGKARLEYSYRMTFPAKTEIVGGNRRE